MASEKKTKGAKFETIGSNNLKKKFRARCKKLNVSQAQRMRDLIQNDVKWFLQVIFWVNARMCQHRAHFENKFFKYNAA